MRVCEVVDKLFPRMDSDLVQPVPDRTKGVKEKNAEGLSIPQRPKYNLNS